MSVAADFNPGRGSEHAFVRLGVLGWSLIAALAGLAAAGVITQYSVGGCAFEGDAARHAVRVAAGFIVMMMLAAAPLWVWSALAYPAYVGALALLLGVELFGEVVNNSKRWLALGPIRIQPSEIMKLAVVLALAKYYHRLSFDGARGALGHLAPALMIAAPTLLIAAQPDLGTALLVAATGVLLIFVSGVRWTVIAYGLVVGVMAMIMLYVYGLRDYQRERILTLFNPAADPMGAGYQAHQSIIAIGSGATWGKGLCRGTQNQNDFVPENETDFILSALAEEWGFVGTVGLLALVAAILTLSVAIALNARHHFGRMAVLGVTATFALYIVINVGMVTALLPVVGVPFPLLSYGGTVMFTVLASFGLVLNIHANRHVHMPRHGLSVI